MLKNTLKLLFFTIFIMNINVATAEPWEENEHYEVLNDPVRVGTGPEVIEFFYYGCPHCFRLEPYLKNWLKTKPSNVSFYPIPATFSNKRWDWSARLYYTAKFLNVESIMHDEVFHKIHEGTGIKSSKDMINLFAKAGVSQEQFEKTFNGFAVHNSVEKARKLSIKTQITGVPNILVNGKYLTSVSQAGGNAQLFRLVNWLLKQPE